MLYLKFHLLYDYSGCTYTLMMGNIFIKSWHVTYGWNRRELMEKEYLDRKRMELELHDLGLTFSSLEVKVNDD